MERKIYTIYSKNSTDALGNIVVDPDGFVSYSLAEPRDVSRQAYQREALERILGGLRDSFGQIVLFEDPGGGQRMSVSKRLLPGRDAPEEIQRAVKKYLAVLAAFYEIHEV